nr:MAG TPA: hypothetical protein [Caudoviricetes sp.]DAR55813.1 MAG TPA: hypothetical protein [Caudoviricetes sp.]
MAVVFKIFPKKIFRGRIGNAAQLFERIASLLARR